MMCYWVLNDAGKVLARTTVQHVLQSECNQYDIQEPNDSINTAFRDHNFVSDLDGFDRLINEDVPLVKETESGYSIQDDINIAELDGVVDHSDAVKQEDTFDMLILLSMQLQMHSRTSLLLSDGYLTL